MTVGASQSSSMAAKSGDEQARDRESCPARGHGPGYLQPPESVGVAEVVRWDDDSAGAGAATVRAPAHHLHPRE